MAYHNNGLYNKYATQHNNDCSVQNENISVVVIQSLTIVSKHVPCWITEALPHLYSTDSP